MTFMAGSPFGYKDFSVLPDGMRQRLLENLRESGLVLVCKEDGRILLKGVTMGNLHVTTVPDSTMFYQK